MKFSFIYIACSSLVFATQNGFAFELNSILALMPEGATIEYSQTTRVVEEASYGEYVIRQRENGTIEVEQNGTVVQP